MRLKIIVIAEDHTNGCKSTKESIVDIPDNALQEGHPADRVRQLATWGVQEAGQYLHSQVQGGGGGGGFGPPPQQHQHQPIQLPSSPAPGQEYGGWTPGQGSAPPFIGEGAPRHGTPAPLDRGRVPRSAEQLIAASSEGLRRAVEDDKRRGANFVVGQQNQPVKVNNTVGWGPHRRK